MMKFEYFFGNYDIVEETIINSIVYNSDTIFDVYDKLVLILMLNIFFEENDFEEFVSNYEFDKKKFNKQLKGYIEKKLNLGEEK